MAFMVVPSGCMPAEFREHRGFVEEQVLNNKSIEHGKLQLDNFTLHYHYRGEAVKAVVLWIHGTPGSWSEIGKLFVDNDFLAEFKFVSIDRPGWGESQFSSPASSGKKRVRAMRASAVSLADQSRHISQLVNLLKQQHPESPLLLAGHSWGASLVPVLAADNLEKVDGALLFAGGISAELTQPRWYHRLAKYWPVSVLIGSELGRSNKEMLALPLSLADFNSRWSELDSLPVMVVQGGKDRLVEPKNAEFAKLKLLAGLHHRVVLREDLGHLLHVSETPLIMQCIRALANKTLEDCY